jgi:hypothetical protein
MNDAAARPRQEPAPPLVPESSPEDVLFDQVAGEVEERQAHLKSMRELGGLSAERERQLVDEIRARTAALQRMRKGRR